MLQLDQMFISGKGSKRGVCEKQTKVSAKLMIGSSMLLSLLCFAPSCSNDAEDTEESFKGVVSNDGTLRLGKKIANPYSLKNVQKAYDELAEKAGVGSEKIEASHLYLKFAPKNEEELRLLEADTTLFFYSYPLDVELIGEGGGYHDPSLPADVPTYQYVCAPVNHPLPEVAYEVLDEVYYEEENDSPLRSGKAISWEDLEEKAYLLAGDSSIIATPETRSSKWRASGYLYYQDVNMNGVYGSDCVINRRRPLVGVPVRMRYHLITYQNCTNSNGYFQCSEKKRGDCKYSIEWKRDAFRIKPNSGVATADYVIQENTKSVNKTFTQNSNVYQWYYATIFTAAHHYFYESIHDLPRPINNVEIKACNANKKGTSSGNVDYKNSFFSTSTDIIIYRNESFSEEIYRSVCHELTHSAHYNNVPKVSWDHISLSLKETWATSVACIMTVDRFGYCISENDDKKSIYACLMADLVDTRTSYAGTQDSEGNEHVSGYTLLQVWKAVVNSKTNAEFKSYLKSSYGVKGNLDELYSYWGW